MKSYPKDTACKPPNKKLKFVLDKYKITMI